MFLQAKERPQHLDHIDWLHERSRGYIFHASKSEAGWKESPYSYKQALQAPIAQVDSYITVNSFAKKKRGLENVQDLRAVFVDLDFGLFNADARYVFDHVKQILHEKQELPQPNMVTFTGRGAHLYWKLKDANQKDVPLWQAVEDTLITIFASDSVDKAVRDVSRVLRLAGTINSKNPLHSTEALHLHQHAYTLEELAHELVAYAPKAHESHAIQQHKPPPAAKPRNLSAKIRYLFTEYTMHHARIQDLVKLVEMRKESGRWSEGKRELTLFIYRTAYSHFSADEQQALEATLRLNKQFTKPLPEREVQRDTASARRLYKLSNKTIIERLDISPDEQRHMKILISRQEKYRRKNEKREQARRKAGAIPRQEYIQNANTLKQKVYELKLSGISNAEMAAQLCISVRNIRRILRTCVLTDK